VIVAALVLATHLSIAPWKGADPKNAIPGATKYRLTVAGAPGARIHLDATGEADGWIAAFCTDKVCSPDRTTLDLPASGRAGIQFELVRDDASAPVKSGVVTIHADGGARVSVPSEGRA
jgi:hypothetical protein